MVTKNQAAIEEKIIVVKRELCATVTAQDGPGTFSYWLGYLRALEWLLQEKNKDG
tara:strand:+ start:9 stop:173 length:165 start_codon:yes stop_codon:yes gene_type:complete